MAEICIPIKSHQRVVPSPQIIGDQLTKDPTPTLLSSCSS